MRDGTLTAAVLGALGVLIVLWSAGAPDGEVRRARAVLGVLPGDQAAPVGWRGVVERWWRYGRARPEWGCAAGGLAVGLLGASVLPLVLGVCAVPGVARVRRDREARRARERR
ncbi:hypothetical protein G3I40_36125, partial [Streptomyces sp. SID14478]|nr:hypothetical protein [Streptomyces sp. SID14478]